MLPQKDRHHRFSIPVLYVIVKSMLEPEKAPATT
jgi:hypothetical protein